MSTRTGYLQGYTILAQGNAQAMVTRDQIIVGADVTREENDVQQLHPMLEQTQEELSAAGVEEEVGVALGS